MVNLKNGDCLELLKTIPSGSVDAVVTDPPYELGFMGKSWDLTGIANNVELWKECLRVLKPGGYLLAFSATRTYHRMAVAIEDAGFEIRDMIEWIYGSGFPKSLNIGKAVDKLQGNERELLNERSGAIQKGSTNWQGQDRSDGKGSGFKEKFIDTKGTSEWEGWGTALKPAHEPICMARKPLSEKTVVENVLKHGTGGINIDVSRVGETGARNNGSKPDKDGYSKNEVFGKYKATEKQDYNMGRFPANLIHDNSEEVRECFPETKSGGGVKLTGKGSNNNVKFQNNTIVGNNWESDSGNASRFFKSIIYQPKASKAERNYGCEGSIEKQVFGDNGGTYKGLSNSKNPDKNFHPTVKPIALMEYLIEMVSREGSTILEPFLGSGTTGIAAVNLNRNFIGFELDKDYFEIAQKRIAAAQIEKDKELF